jgi:hypothetical protein
VQWNRIPRSNARGFEPAADAFDLLEQPVVALGAGIGDAGGDNGVDLEPPDIDGCRQGE